MALYVELYGEAQVTEFELDTDRAYVSLMGALASGTRPHILAIVDDELVGFIAWVIDDSFSTKPIAVMREFYVVRRNRRSAVGRILLGLMMRELKHAGCCLFQAALAPRIPDSAGTVRNLFLKEGMKEVGVVMQKTLT